MALNQVQPESGAARPAATDAISYEDLFARWEQGNWSAMELDFSEDARQWQEDWSEFDRRAALWNYGLFFWGEDTVTDDLSPFIDAAPLEEQKYFLTTQQVDEARHAVFFNRFMHEVCGIGDGSVGSGLEAIRGDLTWGFRQIFDRLDVQADELRKDRSRPMLARAVTLYHVIVEATLAQPGQHFITNYLDQRGTLPAFREGMHNIARDEQRHIGFGVKLLADLVREDPDCRPAVADLLREVIPWTAAVLIPPNWDERYITTFGFTKEEIGIEGQQSFETKMRSAGLPIDELPGPPIMPLDLTPEEQTVRGYDLVRFGVLGEKTGPPSREPEAVELLMDTVRRQVNPDHGFRRPVTLAWDFTDLEPWYLRIDNGSTAAARGVPPDADLTFRCRYEDWVDIVGGRLDARRAVLTRRLKPKGSPRVLLTLPRIFPR